MTRRLTFIVTAIAVLAVIGATSAAVSAQKGAGCGPGNLRCTDEQTDAYGNWSTSDPSVYGVTISPIRGTFSFKDKGTGPAVIQHSTVVFVQLASSSGFGFDCLVIPDSQFVVGNDLQSTTLNTTLTAGMECPGFAQPAISGPGGPGGFQPGGGLPLPLGISVTWTGPGAAFNATSDTMSHCTGITETIHFSGEQTQAHATGTLTLPDLTVHNLGTSNFGFVESFAEALNQTGQPAPQCTLS